MKTFKHGSKRGKYGIPKIVIQTAGVVAINRTTMTRLGVQEENDRVYLVFAADVEKKQLGIRAPREDDDPEIVSEVPHYRGRGIIVSMKPMLRQLGITDFMKNQHIDLEYDDDSGFWIAGVES